MSLIVKTLNEANTTVQETSDFTFFAGEDRTLKLQLFDTNNNSDYMIPSGATVLIILQRKTGTELSKTAVVDSVNRSILSTALSVSETSSMISGNIIVSIVSGGFTRLGRGVNKVVLSSRVKPF